MIQKNRVVLDHKFVDLKKDFSQKKNLFGKYPKNYKPKRPGEAMPRMPNLDKELTNLHAFLNTLSCENT